VPLATKLGAQAFLSVALDEHQATAARIRAVEILTDLVRRVAGDGCRNPGDGQIPELRSRAVWSLGSAAAPGAQSAGLSSNTSLTATRCFAAALSKPFRASQATSKCCCRRLPSVPHDDDRMVRLTVARLLPSLKPQYFKAVADASRLLSWRAALTTTLGYIWRTQDLSQMYYNSLLHRNRSPDSRGESTRPSSSSKRSACLQMGIGDVGGEESATAAFLNYAPGERPRAARTRT